VVDIGEISPVRKKTIDNSKGKVYYGMHFYPGVAEYRESGKDPYRIFINENTIRSMDPTFEGCPIFVEHVNEVNPDLKELRKESVGWVIESFFNAADGKHWAKFVIVDEDAEKAIQKGFRLSNAYFPTSFGQGGQWNGVDYSKEVTSGSYEHLAIVSNPRYDESVILTPEQFKKYNEDAELELKRLANSKDKGDSKMKKFSFFKKAKIEKLENGAELSEICVTLPESKKEVTISEALEIADKFENMQGYANMDHMVKVGEEEMSVNDLVKKYGDMCNEISDLKKASNEEGEEEDDQVENEEDDDKEKDEEKKKNDLKEAAKKAGVKNAKFINAIAEGEMTVEAALEKEKILKANIAALKNAPNKNDKEEETIMLMNDRMQLGQDRYGSGVKKDK
jgi:hypothetical protein